MKLKDPAFLIGLTGDLHAIIGPGLTTVTVRTTDVTVRPDGHVVVNVEPIAGAGSTWVDADAVDWAYHLPPHIFAE